VAVELTLRAAERRDAAELVVLVDVSSHGFASWLWYGAVIDERVDTAMERWRIRMRDDVVEGWWNAVLTEWQGDVAGMAIAFPLDDSVSDAVAPHPVFEPIVELQRRLAGHRFIDSLGVYREHRGKGIGRALLADEIDKAAGGKISLITESHYETALSFYRSNGFAEVSRRTAVPRQPGGKEHDWVLLTRNAAKVEKTAWPKIMT
jgi:GNAT superfamily N-acetyltransferase